MAVYTQVPPEVLAEMLAGYDVGALVSAKGIAEGVENSNYLVDTTSGRFILTLYEKRVDERDLPYFMGLLTHLADRGMPVPRPIPDRRGEVLQELCGRKACLIEFLNGVSLGSPNAAQSRAVGEALGGLHKAVADFAGTRTNSLGLAGWTELAARCGDALDKIEPGLQALVASELEEIGRQWPHDLPHGTIHADLFPDNVLTLGDKVTGLIDFYFACTEIRAWDVAVTHAAWCFDPDGGTFHPDRACGIIDGYRAEHGLSDAEYAALPILTRGAALRFLLTRAWDWLNTPADAMVTRKDSLAFKRRLMFYRNATADEIAGR